MGDVMVAMSIFNVQSILLFQLFYHKVMNDVW